MSNYILYYGLYIVFLFIIKEYMDTFLTDKGHKKIFVCFIWICYFILQIAVGNHINTPLLSLAYNTLSLFLLCIILYKGTLKSKLFLVCIFIVIWMTLELFTAYILTFLNITENNIDDLGSIFSKIMLLIIIKYIQSRVKDISIKDINSQYWVYIIVLPLCSCFIIHNLYVIGYRRAESDILTPISILIILFLNMSFYKIYERLSDDAEMQKQNFVFEKQIELCTEQIKERETRDAEIRELKHNIQGHLLCINEYIKQNDIQGLKEYFNNVYQTLDDKDKKVCDSGNLVIDTIINYKYREALEQGIDFCACINIPINSGFNNADVSIILENALENAIEGTLKLSRKERFIQVKMAYHHQNLLIEISNSFNGVVKTTKDGKLLTLKDDKKNHGMGIQSIEKAVGKYNGLITIEHDKEFVITILLYGIDYCIN